MISSAAKSTREYQRETAAFIALSVAQADGCQVEYQDRVQAPKMLLWAIPGPETTDIINEDSMQEQITRKIFDIPMQHGCGCGVADCPYIGQGDIYAGHDESIIFPPENGVSIQAQVTFEGYEWSVKTVDTDSLHAKYKLHTERHQARRTARI